MKFSSLASVLFVACLQLWNVDAATIKGKRCDIIQLQRLVTLDRDSYKAL